MTNKGNRKYYILLMIGLLTFSAASAQKKGKKHSPKPGKTAMQYFNSGSEKAKEGKYKEAVADLDKSIAMAGKNHEAYYNRGFCEVHLDDYEAAIQDFTKAINLWPKTFPDALYYRGYCYNHQGMYDLAISDFSKALEVHSNGDLWSARGYAYLQNKDYANALSDYTDAIALDPKSVQYLGLRALCHYELHHLKETIEDADKYLAEKPSSPDIIEVELKAKSELKDNEGAYQLAIKLVHYQKTPITFYYKGLTEFYIKKYDEGIEDFSNSLKMDPNYRDSYYGRALCYLGINDDDHACPDLRKAAELGYPNLKGRIEDYCKGVKE